MDRRYQVFVSSTYKDLIQHRQQVIKALMQVDAIPAGMELFPAADDDAWTLIQHTIDESDYYVVIVGGRYGTVDETDPHQRSFTEKEYDYAVSSGKPVMAFLHQSPTDLARDRTETEPKAWARLQAFHRKAELKHCKYWQTPDDLTLVVITSYHHMIRAHPTNGWVRGDQAKTIADVENLALLQQRVSELEAENARLLNSAEDDTAPFAQGTDTVALTFENQRQAGPRSCLVQLTWDDIFCAAAYAMLQKPREYDILETLIHGFSEASIRANGFSIGDVAGDGQRLWQFAAGEKDKIRDQLLALHLIAVDAGPGPIVWSLTAKGVDYLARLKAIRREQAG